MNRPSNETRTHRADEPAPRPERVAAEKLPAGLVPAGLVPLVEMQRLLSTHWQKGLETWIRLLNCRSPAEVACVQFEASAEFASDCLDELTRCLAGAAPVRDPSC